MQLPEASLLPGLCLGFCVRFYVSHLLAEVLTELAQHPVSRVLNSPLTGYMSLFHLVLFLGFCPGPSFGISVCPSFGLSLSLSLFL